MGFIIPIILFVVLFFCALSHKTKRLNTSAQALLFLSPFWGLLYFFLVPPVVSVEVVNGYHQEITELRLYHNHYSNEPMFFESILPSESDRIWFFNTGEGNFYLEGKLKDGKRIMHNGSYLISYGFGNSFVFTLAGGMLHSDE